MSEGLALAFEENSTDKEIAFRRYLQVLWGPGHSCEMCGLLWWAIGRTYVVRFIMSIIASPSGMVPPSRVRHGGYAERTCEPLGGDGGWFSHW